MCLHPGTGEGSARPILPTARKLQLLRKTIFAAAMGAAALAVPSVASAGTVVDSYTNHLASGTESLGTYSLNGYDMANISKWDVDISSRASWSADLRTDVF